jgi:hypothetical protein
MAGKEARKRRKGMEGKDGQILDPSPENLVPPLSNLSDKDLGLYIFEQRVHDMCFREPTVYHVLLECIIYTLS